MPKNIHWKKVGLTGASWSPSGQRTLTHLYRCLTCGHEVEKQKRFPVTPCAHPHRPSKLEVKILKRIPPKKIVKRVKPRSKLPRELVNATYDDFLIYIGKHNLDDQAIKELGLMIRRNKSTLAGVTAEVKNLHLLKKDHGPRSRR